MASYNVLVNDNARYMDITEVSEHGIFASAAEAVAACKRIVDDFERDVPTGHNRS